MVVCVNRFTFAEMDTYNYLKDGRYIPKHLAVAISLIGAKEISGPASNPLILNWAEELGLSNIYKNDLLSWCGLFVAFCMYKAGRTVLFSNTDPYNYLRALKYKDAISLTTVSGSNAGFADILIFQREGGGHICFYVGEDEDCFHCLGGNQGNEVDIVRISKARLVAVRRPRYDNYKPVKIFIKSITKISENEN